MQSRSSIRLASLATGLLLIASLSGCASTRRQDRNPQELAATLRNLSVTVDDREAELSAQTACELSAQLAREYRVVRPAILHNVLVNAGIRRRGLCFHWADDLATRLRTLRLRTLDVHRGVAHLQTLREHNCVVLTAAGDDFEFGIALDAWRDCGVLHWSSVRADKYPWEQDHVIEQQDLRGGQ